MAAGIKNGSGTANGMSLLIGCHVRPHRGGALWQMLRDVPRLLSLTDPPVTGQAGSTRSTRCLQGDSDTVKCCSGVLFKSLLHVQTRLQMD